MWTIKSFQARLRYAVISDSGAVTVDWVVLAAAVVGLGAASVASVRNGTGALATDIQASLSSASVADLSWMHYQFRMMGADEPWWNNFEDRIIQAQNFDDVELFESFEIDVSIPFEAAMATGFNDPCLGCRGAANRLDLMHIQLAEFERRGLATPEMHAYVADATLRYTVQFP